MKRIATAQVVVSTVINALIHIHLWKHCAKLKNRTPQIEL